MGGVNPDWPWSSASATRQGLADRIAARYPREQRSQRTAETAYRRLLARFAVGLDVPWALAGGVALTLRLDPSRTSGDIDLILPGEGGDPVDVAFRLRQAAHVDLGDYMDFDVERPRGGAPPRTGARTVELRATASIGGSVWAAFPIDVTLATEAVRSEPLDAVTSLTGIPIVDDLAGLPVLPMPVQIAQKVCAMFETHGQRRVLSTRARDLADIAMASQQVQGLLARDLMDALADEVAERCARGTLGGRLPSSLDLPDAMTIDWSRRWSRAAMHADVTFEAALDEATAFLDPLLGGTATGRWNPGLRRWA